MTIVRLIHSSQQFSDDHAAHAHDAQAVFDHAAKIRAWVVTGTEAGVTKDGHDLRDALIREAGRYNFEINAHPYGEWVACNRAYLQVTDKGYVGPLIKSGSNGAHSPRGITWMQGKAHGSVPGTLTFGVSHYLTERSIKAGGQTNRPLISGIAAFGHKYGEGANKVFFSADVNMNDAKENVFRGGPFRTCWDELHKHPPTRARGTIDVIASYNGDGKVSAERARALDDGALKLYTDHYLIEAAYKVTE